ncbi:MAG: dimethyl sulfoxide reductase anchor subunit [Minwuiales bacterium]|nr:dimethyl sulfoxide reductase anchor subunit [Minwuiales bacterium]
MHPAFSVIFFTTASGAGYGLLAWFGVFVAFGMLPADRWFGLVGLGLALGLITVGLLSSTFHLGHPERAWRAFSQWRSSWLSREGVAAVATYLPAGLFGVGWVFFEQANGLLGLLSAVGAAVTVYCTGMIYTSLKPVRRWHNKFVVPVYLGFAAMTGAVWLTALAGLFGIGNPLFAWLSLAALAITAAIKLRYWRSIDNDRGGSTAATATGLAGPVRLLDPPHTEENYLMREMGYRVARKHAEKLRRIALAVGFAAPAALLLLSLLLEGRAAGGIALVAALAATGGALVERWLFFAEAKHAVTLYYGAQSA